MNTDTTPIPNRFKKIIESINLAKIILAIVGVTSILGLYQYIFTKTHKTIIGHIYLERDSTFTSLKEAKIIINSPHFRITTTNNDGRFEVLDYPSRQKKFDINFTIKHSHVNEITMTRSVDYLTKGEKITVDNFLIPSSSISPSIINLSDKEEKSEEKEENQPSPPKIKSTEQKKKDIEVKELSGVVINEQGKFVAGARVKFGEETTITDKKGQFIMIVPNVEEKLEIRKDELKFTDYYWPKKNIGQIKISSKT